MRVARSFRKTGAISLAGSILSLAGCAVTVPASVTSTQPATQPVTNIEFVGEPGETGLRADFKQAVIASFAEKGIGETDDADFVVDFSVAQHDPALTITPIDKGDETRLKEGSSFKSRWYHECKPHNVSATLVLYAKQSGNIIGRSTGEYLSCPGDKAELRNLASLLVQKTLSR